MTSKTHYNLAILFILTIFIFGCETIPEGKKTPLPGEPVAYFPKMKVGDWWVLKMITRSQTLKQDIVHNKVINVSKDGSFVIESKIEKVGTYRLFYNNKMQLIMGIEISTGNRMKTIDPPSKPLNFPLFVGKKWKEHFWGKSVSGRTYEYDNFYTVKSIEMVNTKAGTFKAFKIEMINRIVNTASSGTEIYWYSPEIKAIVKAKPSWKPGTELLSYNVVK
jgi:hypothetical protein